MGVVSFTEDKIERLLEASAKTRRAVKTAKPSDDYWRRRLQAQTHENRRACAELRRLKKILSDRRMPIAAQVLKLEDQVFELQGQLELCRVQAEEKLKAERAQAEKKLSALRAEGEETRKTLRAEAERTIKALRTDNEHLRAANERLQNQIRFRTGKHEWDRISRELAKCRKYLDSERKENNRLRRVLEGTNRSQQRAPRLT